jgi:hypothetical protein
MLYCVLDFMAIHLQIVFHLSYILHNQVDGIQRNDVSVRLPTSIIFIFIYSRICCPNACVFVSHFFPFNVAIRCHKLWDLPLQRCSILEYFDPLLHGLSSSAFRQSTVLPSFDYFLPLSEH